MGTHPSGPGPQVPLPEYVENMRKIGTDIKVLLPSSLIPNQDV